MEKHENLQDEDLGTTSEAAEPSQIPVSEPIMLEIPELQEMAANVKEILVQVQDFTYKDGINSRLHEELQKYKSGLCKDFLSPLLKGIIREYDRAIRQYHIYSQKKHEQGEEYSNLLKQFENMAFALLDLLSDFDIETFEVKEGEAFSAKEHRIAEIIETTEVNKDVTIAASINCGFKDMSNERVMRHAEVNIYKLKK